MSKPLLSIVVPTKDRYNCLINLIQLIDSFNSEHIELVIQDNNRDNSPIINHIKNKKYIVYDHIPEQIPISLNCDKAILNSSGEYVCFIGDDDGVTNHIVDCVKWMKNNNIDVVVPARISYYWPDFISSTTGNISGSLSFKKFNDSCDEIDIKCALKKAMETGFTSIEGLPVVYHGIVSRCALNDIYNISGSFFPGQSPDIANAVSLCFTSKNCFRVNFPIIITGASASVGGGIRKLKNGFAEIQDVPFLSKNAKDEWETKIPRIWCGPTIWCESAVKALRRMGYSELISDVNFEKLYLILSVNNTRLMKMSKCYTSNLGIFYTMFILEFAKRCVMAAIRLSFRRLNLEYPIKLKRIYGINCITEANNYIINQYPKNSF